MNYTSAEIEKYFDDNLFYDQLLRTLMIFALQDHYAYGFKPEKTVDMTAIYFACRVLEWTGHAKYNADDACWVHTAKLQRTINKRLPKWNENWSRQAF